MDSNNHSNYPPHLLQPHAVFGRFISMERHFPIPPATAGTARMRAYQRILGYVESLHGEEYANAVGKALAMNCIARGLALRGSPKARMVRLQNKWIKCESLRDLGFPGVDNWLRVRWLFWNERFEVSYLEWRRLAEHIRLDTIPVEPDYQPGGWGTMEPDSQLGGWGTMEWGPEMDGEGGWLVAE